MFFSGVNPYGSDSMDNISPTNNPTQQPQEVKGFYVKPGAQSFVQKYWHFDEEEAKKFITTLCNSISNEIKHIDERNKETAEKLKQAEQGEDS